MNNFQRNIYRTGSSISTNAKCYKLTISNSTVITDIGTRYSTISNSQGEEYIFTFEALNTMISYDNGDGTTSYYVCSTTYPAIVHMSDLIPFVWTEGQYNINGESCLDNSDCTPAP